MTVHVGASIDQYFGELKDPRSDHTKRHKLLDIIVITICAVLSGADDFPSVEQYGHAKYEWLKTFLELPNGIPAHDTFWRVFRHLDSEQFERCFIAWIAAVNVGTQGRLIAVDGKQLRRSHDKCADQRAIGLVSAWASEAGLALGQLKVDDKSNEITAIPELLALLEISGCLVTIDAIGCQTKLAAAIIAQDGDYLFALKENQPALYQDVDLLFRAHAEGLLPECRVDYAHDVAGGHGRIEVREVWAITDPAWVTTLPAAANWPNLRTLIRVKRERRHPIDNTPLSAPEVSYYISSRSTSAQRLLAAIRSHWQIENGQHWMLDIAFREDDSRLRKDNGARNFALARRITLNCLKQEKTCKLGIKNKRLKAAWDNDYMLKVLATLFD